MLVRGYPDKVRRSFGTRDAIRRRSACGHEREVSVGTEVQSAKRLSHIFWYMLEGFWV